MLINGVKYCVGQGVSCHMECTCENRYQCHGSVTSLPTTHFHRLTLTFCLSVLLIHGGNDLKDVSLQTGCYFMTLRW